MLLSYAALDIDPLDRLDTMRQYDTARDGKLNRVEFCQLCVDLLWNVDEDHLERALENSRAAKTGLKRRNSCYWKNMADYVDM